MTPAHVARLVHALDESGCFRCPPGELSIAILGAREMGALHAEFLDDPAPTDVITFDGDPLFGSAGEICVCADVAREYARDNGDGDFASELSLYVTHGYLHLAGFDDTTAPARRAMRAAEQQAMAILAAANVILPVR